jgi:hypothetical protein
MEKTILILIICCCLICHVCAGISIAGTTMFKSISESGVTSDNIIDISESSNDASMVSIDVGGEVSSTMKGSQIQTTRLSPPIKTISVQLLPEAQVSVSEDGNTFMQFVDSSYGEIYYGYQQDILHPWSQYYQVRDGNIIHADFSTRKVWITPIDNTKIQGIIDSGEIPDWDDLL